MEHIKIEQNSNVEVVDSNIIHKLAEEAQDCDASSNMTGNLQTDKAFVADVDFLRAKFPGLTINATQGLYISFQDPLVQQLLIGAGVGDGTGIMTTDVATLNFATNASIREIFKDSDIEYFDELQYFVSTDLSQYVFHNCYKLKHIKLPSTLGLIHTCLIKNDSADTDSADITVDWNGATPSFSTYNSIYNGVKGLTFKDSLIPPMTDLSACTIFFFCKSLEKIIFREGITKSKENGRGCTSLMYTEYPVSTTDMGMFYDYHRDGSNNSVIVIKSTIPPRYVYQPNNSSPFGQTKWPVAVYVPDSAVNTYKTQQPWSIGSDGNAEQTVWSYQDMIDRIKPLSELPQVYREMGTVTQEDIDRV